MLGRRLIDDDSVGDRFQKLISLFFYNRYQLSDFSGLTPSQLSKLKKYTRLSDALYYSVGDAFEANFSHEPFIISSRFEDDFRSLGFRKVGELLKSDDNVTNVLRYELPFNGCNLVGVDYNSKSAAIKKGVRFDAYDLFRPNNLSTPLDNFQFYCVTRLRFNLPRSFIDVILSISNYYAEFYKRKLDVGEIVIDDQRPRPSLNPEDNRLKSYLEILTDGFSEYKFKKGTLICSGDRIVSPAPSSGVSDGQRKNRTVVEGFMHNYDRYVLLGEAPGKYYNRFNHYINKENCVIYDPRDIEFSKHATHFKRLFGYSDADHLALTAERNPNLRYLVRIDIRSDKPVNAKEGEYNESWELSIHEDNRLIVSLINRMPSNVTILAKIRPVYIKGIRMPEISKKLLLLPEPHLTPSTAEFILFVPASFLGYTDSDLLDGRFITYDLIDSHSNQVCALKRYFGRFYNFYLTDMYYWLNVIKPTRLVLENAIGLYSLSNVGIGCPNDYLRVLAGGMQNSVITMPYGRAGANEQKYVTRGRVYTDHVINAYHEVTTFKNFKIAPVYHLSDGRCLNVNDLFTVIITDKDLIDYTQREGLLSTQVVKLVTYALDKTFEINGLQWKTVNLECRIKVLRELHSRAALEGYPASDFSLDLTRTGINIRGNFTSVSGHMIYILLGSFLGVPYGINKYLLELEYHVSTASFDPNNGWSRSYEGGRGTQLWHSYFSHTLAIRCVKDMLSYLTHFKEKEQDEISYVLQYVQHYVDQLAVKYPHYRLHDEYLKF